MDVQVAMVTAPGTGAAWQLLVWLQQGRQQAHRGAVVPALSLEHPVQGTHAGIVWLHGATFLLDPGEADCMRMRASAASLKHPPSGSTAMGRGWLEEVEKTGTENLCLNGLFLERAFSCLFMREEFHALASKAGL